MYTNTLSNFLVHFSFIFSNYARLMKTLQYFSYGNKKINTTNSIHFTLLLNNE